MKPSCFRVVAVILLIIAFLSTVALGVFTIYIGVQCEPIVFDILEDSRAPSPTIKELVESNCTLVSTSIKPITDITLKWMD